MNIEEKAKAYDETLERARKLYERGTITESLGDVFPKLKESEDERIKTFIRGLILPHIADAHIVGDRIVHNKDIDNYRKALAWLEKQGKNNMGISEATKKKLEDSLNKALEKETSESWNGFLEKQGKYKSADKFEPKFKVGDAISKKHNSDINDFGSFTITDITGGKYWYNDRIICDITEQDKWELVEQKPAWSEEDEVIYYGVIETEQYMLDVVNGIKKFDVGNISIKEECTRELNWLKFLKDRIQLK